MSDQSKLGLGQIITTEQHRDAIHVAVAPVTAARRLLPGDHVGLDADGKATDLCDKTIGVVDPFLKGKVLPDECFWLFLYPGSITSLRHEWTHPAFRLETISREDHIVKSNQWIAAHAEYLDITVAELMSSAEDWLVNENYTVEEGSEHWRDSFNSKEFWHHYEVISGKAVPEEKKQSFFCCRC